MYTRSKVLGLRPRQHDIKANFQGLSDDLLRSDLHNTFRTRLYLLIGANVCTRAKANHILIFNLDKVYKEINYACHYSLGSVECVRGM